MCTQNQTKYVTKLSSQSRLPFVRDAGMLGFMLDSGLGWGIQISDISHILLFLTLVQINSTIFSWIFTKSPWYHEKKHSANIGSWCHYTNYSSYTHVFKCHLNSSLLCELSNYYTQANGLICSVSMKNHDHIKINSWFNFTVIGLFHNLMFIFRGWIPRFNGNMEATCDIAVVKLRT